MNNFLIDLSKIVRNTNMTDQLEKQFNEFKSDKSQTIRTTCI